MTHARITVLLIGCEELAPVVAALGYDVELADYFWGCSEAVSPVWQAAIVSTRVGGNTGLSVAERLVDHGVVPIVAYQPGERCRVEPRFMGIPVRRREALEELPRMLAECVRMSTALRGDAPTTEMRVRSSMIVRVDSTAS